MNTVKKRRTPLPVVLTIEDEAGMDGWPYDAIVPLLFVRSRKGFEGECSFGAYPILRAYLDRFRRSGNPFSKESLGKLDEMLAPYLKEIGCERGGGIYRYYRSFVIWDREKLNTSAIRADSVLLTKKTAQRVAVNRTDFDLEELLEKNLPAAMTLTDGELVSICTVNEAGEGQRLMELSVYTRPAFRGRGCGASNAALLADHLLRHGKGAVYVTSCRNRASLKLVQKLGFESESRFYAVDAYKIRN